MWALYVVFFLILIAIFICFTKVTVDLELSVDGKKQNINITIFALFRLIKYKVKIPEVNINERGSIEFKEQEQLGDGATTKKAKQKWTPEEISHQFENIKNLLRHVRGLFVITKNLLKHIQVKQFYWNSSLGVGDAAITGALAGALWTLKGSVLGLLHHFMNVQTKPYIHVSPLFQQAAIRLTVRCMFSLRIGQAILAAIRILLHWRKSIRRK